MAIEIKNSAYFIDGEKKFLYSGEFHYFRVPKKDWKKRLILLKEMGGNCVGTYVPWIIHEPVEGNIVFGDVENRDLCGFLDICKELSLNVILRPGPLQYSELVNDGLPCWLLENYPEICVQTADGNFREDLISYMHPVFLKKARIYFREFANVARKYMNKNGGPVCMVQVDNELTGMHVWRGVKDYNEETCGFGKENGAYPLYLQNKYSNIDKLNKAYGTDYQFFKDVKPVDTNENSVEICRRKKDFLDFYLDMCGKYLSILEGWLREDGIEEMLCHNSGGPAENGYFDTVIEKMGSGFLLGSDHYYNLDSNWAQNNPTPQYAIKVLYSMEQLRNMGMPPTVMELPGGTIGEIIPIKPEDLYACYMTNTAMGMKGANLYVYTGGPNFEKTGVTCDTYDYCALIHADGTKNDTYYSASEFGKFINENAWLQSAKRAVSVTVAYENEWQRSRHYALIKDGTSQCDILDFLKSGVLHSALCSSFAPQMTDISKFIPETDKPMILCSSHTLSENSQKNVVAFLKNGGNLLIMGNIPELDENYNECTILKDYLRFDVEAYSIQKKRYIQGHNRLSVTGMENNIYSLNIKGKITNKDCLAIGKIDNETNDVLVAEKEIGKSKVIYASFSYTLVSNVHLYFFESLLKRLEAKETVYHSNPCVIVSLLEDENNKKLLFLLNLFSSENKTDIKVNGKEFNDIVLKPMEVKTIML